MKRIIAVSTLAVATLVGFSSAASAQVTATSEHKGTVVATCAVTGIGGTFTATGNTPFNIVNFPSELISSGKFTTLCNTATSGIKVAKTIVTVPTDQVPAPDVTFTTTSDSTPAVYTGAIIGTSGTGATAELTGNAVHRFNSATSDLNVAVKVTAPAGKILQGNATNDNYRVVLTATLTP